jgi:hypothetical protein
VPKAAGQSAHTSFSATLHTPTHITLQWNKTPEKEAQGVLSVQSSGTEQVVSVNGLEVVFRVVHGTRQRYGRVPNCVMRVSYKYPPLQWDTVVMIQAGTKVGFVVPPPPPPPPGFTATPPSKQQAANTLSPTAAGATAYGSVVAAPEPFQFFIKASRMGLPTHVAVEYQCGGPTATQERVVYVQQAPVAGAAEPPAPSIRRALEFDGLMGGVFDLDVFEVYSTANPPPAGIRIAIRPRYYPLPNNQLN